MTTKPKEEKLPKNTYKSTPAFKFKDNPKERQFVKVNFLQSFGFIPEEVIMAKQVGSNNRIGLIVVVPPAEVKREEEQKAKEQAKLKEVLKEAEKLNAKSK